MKLLNSVIALFLLIPTANADSVVKYGAALSKSNDKFGNTKSIFLAYQESWLGPFIYQYEFGYWSDSNGQGRRSSMFGSTSFGVEVITGYVFTQALVGPAVISCPDTLLGGGFQFNNDFAIGLKGNNGNSIGLSYKHVSSAGLEQPNAGRDFLMLRVGIPW